MARRPSGEGDDKRERGGLFDDGDGQGFAESPDANTDTDDWYQPGSRIGQAPTAPGSRIGQAPTAPGSRIGPAPTAPPANARAPQRPGQPAKLDAHESTRIATSPLLDLTHDELPLEPDDLEDALEDDSDDLPPAAHAPLKPAAHAPLRPAAHALLAPMAQVPTRAATPSPIRSPASPAPPLAGDATRLLTLDDTPPPYHATEESTRILSGPGDAARAFLGQPQRPAAQAGSDSTRMINVGSDTTRISSGMPNLSALMAAGGAALPVADRTARTAGPQFGASKEARSKIIARGAGGNNEESTRIVQIGEAAVPAWRPAAVARANTAPDTLAWEKEEGTVARIVDSLKVLTGGKDKKDRKAKAPTGAAPADASGTLLKLRLLPFLAGIDDGTLDAALRGGALALQERGRDFLFDAEGSALLLVEGQVALGRFAKEKLAVERAAQGAAAAGDASDKKAAKKEAKRRMEAGPLIRLAEANVAFFEKGDLVHVRDQPPPPGLALGVYSTTPITGVTIRNDLLEQWKRAYPFFADRVRRASNAARGRIEAVGGARSEVADFFIRHGLSVSLVLRVRAIDMCIECGACEQACEDRYGAKRLSLGGRKLGTLDFVDACHTCTDQRCIDPCAFDAIKFDAEKKEVVIIEGACTGCTLCATACPYAAIEMHDFEDKPLFQLRLDKQGKLAFGADAAPIQTQFGPIKARKAKAKRIASKCDHCIDYADQACISACPTGALVDVEPGDVFAARSAVISAQADDGYDHSRILDVAALNDPRLFQQGMSSRQAQGMDKGRTVGKRIGTTWMWVLGIGAWLIAFAEIMLRKLSPAHSIDFLYATMVEGMEKEIALDRVDFHAGTTFALRLGYVGSVLMFSGLLYPLRRRVPLFKNVGSQKGWFDIHVLTGVIGPLFVSLHTAAKLNTWVASAVWAMVLTALSGILGRYVFTQIPEWASAATLHERDAVGKLDDLRGKHPGVRALDNWFLAYQKRVAAAAALSGPRVVLWLFADWLRAIPLGFDLTQRVAGVVDPAARRESVRQALLLAKYERHKVLLPKLEPLARRWKVVHVPAAILLTLLGGIHIVISLLA